MNAPLRWKDEGSEVDPALQRLMRHAREQGPSDAQLAALTERVRARLPAERAPAAPAGGGAFMSKIVATSVAVVLAVLGGWLALAGRPKDVRSPDVSPRTTNEQAVRPAVPGAEPAHEQAAQESAARATEPADEWTVPAPSVSAEPPEPRKPGRRSGQAARSNPAPTQPAPAPDELALLHRARLLARTDATHALSAVREHERLYPEGAFREEREALLIELLCRTGQQTKARAHLEAFTERYPESAYGARVRRWLNSDVGTAETPTRSR